MKFVKIPGRNFEMADAPVTQREWKKVMGTEPSKFKGENNPVECVSWYDCQEFIEKLNTKSKKYVYALPTEEEWEHCANPCSDQKVESIAWCRENSNGSTHPIRNKPPNYLRLYDMLGNVSEWCLDCNGSTSGSFRGMRGGGWDSVPRFLRPAYRYGGDPSFGGSGVGFRPLRTCKTLNSNTFTLNKKQIELATAKVQKALDELKILLNTGD